MLKYAMQTAKMDELMGLLSRVLNLRITFFDLQESELSGFNIKGLSPFCRSSRQKAASFRAACALCDREHLLTAKRSGGVHIYQCHAGLLEGIVPLYDRHKIYLGSIVFGQLRDEEMEYPAADMKLLSRNRKSSKKEMHDIGALLKCSSEYIIENELVQYRSKPWAERLDDYIVSHLSGRVTLSGMSKEIGRSTSFLSHNFPLEFGMPLKEYVLK